MMDSDANRNPVMSKFEVMTRYAIDGVTLVQWEYDGLPCATVTLVPGRLAKRIYPLEHCDLWVRRHKSSAIPPEMHERLLRVNRPSEYVSLREAATRLGVTPTTVSARIKCGKLNGFKAQDSSVWIREDELPKKPATKNSAQDKGPRRRRRRRSFQPINISCAATKKVGFHGKDASHERPG